MILNFEVAAAHEAQENYAVKSCLATLDLWFGGQYMGGTRPDCILEAVQKKELLETLDISVFSEAISVS